MLVGSIWNLLPAERKLSSVGESKGENYEIKLMGKNGLISFVAEQNQQLSHAGLNISLG